MRSRSRLKKAGQRPTHIEGYKQSEWVLLDYVDFVVHVFSEKARKFYDLERLWKSAKRLEPSELAKPKRTNPERRKEACLENQPRIFTNFTGNCKKMIHVNQRKSVARLLT